MRTLIWSRASQRDLQDIQAFWRRRDPSLIVQLFVETQRATEFLLETQGAGAPAGTDLRKWRIGRTPYLLFYRVDDLALRIVRVFHERQNWLNA